MSIQTILLATLFINESKLNLITDLTNAAFNEKEKYCINVITNVKSNEEVMLGLGRSEAARVLKSFQTFNKTLIKNCLPTGYIVVANDENKLLQTFEQDNFLPNTRVLIFHQNAIDFGAYAFTAATHLRAVDVIVVDLHNISVTSLNGGATYSQLQELRARKQWQPKFGRREKFRIGIFHYHPMILYSAKRGLYGGIEKYMLDIVTGEWPVEYVIYAPYAWDAILDDLLKNNLDMGACAFWHVSVTFLNVDMTAWYHQVCSTFLVQKPTLLPFTNFVFQPFAPSFWWQLFLIIVAVALILCAFHKQRVAGFFDFFLLIFQTLLLNSGARFPLKSAIRFTVTAWCLSAVLLSTAYSAGYTKILSFPAYTKPVNTVKDVVTQKLHWKANTNSSIVTFNTSSNPYTRQLVNLAVWDDKNWNTLAISCNIIQHYIDKTDQLNNSARANMKVLHECFGLYYFVFPLKKNSPFTQIFNKHIVRFVEHGLIYAWFTKVVYTDYELLKIMPSFFQTYPDENLSTTVLTVPHVQGAFYLLFAGYFLSLISFIFELIQFNCTKNYFTP